MECSDDEKSSDNEVEPLAARIARQSRATKAKVKYTLSGGDDDEDNDDEDNDDDAIDDNDGKDSSEDEWMEIRSSDSEDELSIIEKIQMQPPKNKKAMKFATPTKDKMDARDSETTGVVKGSVIEEDEATDEIKIMDNDNLELPSTTKPLTDSKPPTDSKLPAEKPKKKAATKKQPKQDNSSKKTTQTTLFDTGVKLKAGAKRKTATNTDEASSSLPKKPAKQPPKPKVNDEYSRT